MVAVEVARHRFDEYWEGGSATQATGLPHRQDQVDPAIPFVIGGALHHLAQSPANRNARSARLFLGSTPSSTTNVHRQPSSRSNVRANIPASSRRGRYWF